MGVLENYKARVTGTVGSSLKEYVKNMKEDQKEIYYFFRKISIWYGCIYL